MVVKTIQIRDVPDEVHRTLRIRAAEHDMSMSDYLRNQLAALAGLPTIREVLARRESRVTGLTSEEVVDIVREGRREREEHLDAVLRRLDEGD